MWLQLWMTVILCSSVWSDQSDVKDDGSFSWSWQMATTEQGSGTAGHYFVKLPEAPQTYVANTNGTQEVIHSSYVNVHPGMDIYFLSSQISHEPLQEQNPYYSQYQELNVPNTNPSITQIYNMQIQSQKKYVHNNTESREGNSQRDPNTRQNNHKNEPKVDNSLPVNQVFKVHNCSDNSVSLETTSKELYNDMQKSKELFAEVPYYDALNIDGDFGTRETTDSSSSYRGTVHYRVETPNPQARKERLYLSNLPQNGINKLVESTQDLISNEDLMKINNAIEKHLNDQSDDIIKPKPRFNPRKPNYRGDSLEEDKWKNQRVKERIREIFQSETKPTENTITREEFLQANTDEYKFASPIVVTDIINNSKEQIVNNLVSTMIPYIENGYQIVSVRNSNENNNTKCNDVTKETVEVTPRSLTGNYLAPITVGLKLFNANHTTNSYDDFETAETELITDPVSTPQKERTVVEIQESFPIEITHINDVEVHEYLEEGRFVNKHPPELSESLYDKYIDALNSSQKMDDESDYTDSKENIESSENIQTEVEVKPENNGSNQNSEFVSYNSYEDRNKKIIQPIVIEKEIPITKFVDRFIEKEVPYTERVEVPVEVTRYVDKPYPVEVPLLYPVEVKVPYPVQQQVYTKVVEKPIHIEVPVPHPVAVPVYLPQPYPVDRIIEKNVPYPVPVERIVEKNIPVQVPYPVEKLVEKIVQKPILVTKYVDKPFPVERKVPYPVEKIVEKKVPYPVDRIIERKIPYPVEKIVEKKLPYPVQVPVEVKIPYPVEKHISVPVFRYFDKREESRNNYSYQKPKNQLDQNINANSKDKLFNPNIQSTQWGNQYTSSNKNNTQENKTDLKTRQSLRNYMNYLVNSHKSPLLYVPSPLQNQKSWEKSKNHESKVRRTDRIPKMANLRIEYGGFRPPLIPSTEVDLDGVPVYKTE